YKDEYEVARLYTDGTFERSLAERFEGAPRLAFHLAPPLLSRPRPGETEPRKMRFGPWIMPAFRLLARGKRLRGTAFDLFGYTAERRAERGLVAEYEATLRGLLPGLSPATADTVAAIAGLPHGIRGFGPVKERAMREAAERRRSLLAELDRPTERQAA
ncbi:MAG: indolepyruvate ferredoxin oxidoreductase family protein, partial [Methylobacteriaceae bacterium]|nr:indolepyruvate ferredoxin oxidoreductase family protein [Methylobacteriaceae bacterium]